MKVPEEMPTLFSIGGGSSQTFLPGYSDQKRAWYSCSCTLWELGHSLSEYHDGRCNHDWISDRRRAARIHVDQSRLVYGRLRQDCTQRNERADRERSVCRSPIGRTRTKWCRITALWQRWFELDSKHLGQRFYWH
jgi:hypothetical protein